MVLPMSLRDGALGRDPKSLSWECVVFIILKNNGEVLIRVWEKLTNPGEFADVSCIDLLRRPKETASKASPRIGQ
jgi:hypothetical protein